MKNYSRKLFPGAILVVLIGFFFLFDQGQDNTEPKISKTGIKESVEQPDARRINKPVASIRQQKSPNVNKGKGLWTRKSPWEHGKHQSHNRFYDEKTNNRTAKNVNRADANPISDWNIGEFDINENYIDREETEDDVVRHLQELGASDQEIDDIIMPVDQEESEDDIVRHLQELGASDQEIDDIIMPVDQEESEDDIVMHLQDLGASDQEIDDIMMPVDQEEREDDVVIHLQELRSSDQEIDDIMMPVDQEESEDDIVMHLQELGSSDQEIDDMLLLLKEITAGDRARGEFIQE